MDDRSEFVLIVGGNELATLVARALAPRFVTLIATTCVEGVGLLVSEPRIAAVGVSTTVRGGSVVQLLDSPEAERTATFVIVQDHDTDLVNSAGKRGVPLVAWPFDAACIDGLITATRSRHQAFIARAIREGFIKAAHPSTPWSREDEVCWQTILGAQPKDVANDRGMKDKTVYGIRDRIRHRLHVTSLNELREQILQPVLPDWRTKK